MAAAVTAAAAVTIAAIIKVAAVVQRAPDNSADDRRGDGPIVAVPVVMTAMGVMSVIYVMGVMVINQLDHQ